MSIAPELIVTNAKIHTLDPGKPLVEALACHEGKIVATGSNEEIRALAGSFTKVIDANRKTIIPGLNDSHLHLIRAGLNYNLELRWDGVDSLADALAMLKNQAIRTPAPQWVRVVGGWSEFQFKERRMPTLDEINAVSGDVPVFILHLYDRALLNRAALRAVGYTKDTPDLPGAEIQRDTQGNPTGMLIARPNAFILYKTLSMGPKLDPDDQVNSTRHFMRELNRLGVTSCIDAGGGFQNYPDDYAIIQKLHGNGELTVRIAYNLFTQRAGAEKDDFVNWAKIVKPGDGDGKFRMNGAGEMLVFSAADFEDFLEPRPDLAATMESELEQVVSVLAANRWPFRLHATYDESISRFLDVFEKVNQAIPFNGLRWWFDHAETLQPRNIERIRALGGGVAVQHRMAYQGEYFTHRYGADAAKQTPPIRRMLAEGIPVGAGTDATRVASYNPWVALSWLATGQTVGGLTLYGDENLVSREEALRLYTVGSAWFSGEESVKGTLSPGQYADFAVLSKDYFSVPDQEIRTIQSELTVMDGQIVHGSGDFSDLSPALPKVSPSWSPVATYGGWGAPGAPSWSQASSDGHTAACACPSCSSHAADTVHDLLHGVGLNKGDRPLGFDLWGSGCACWTI